MNFDFLFEGLEAKDTNSRNACVKCNNALDETAGSSTCPQCLQAESYVNGFRGDYPEDVLTAMFNLDVCKRRIARLIEEERNGIELDITLLLDIEIKIHQVLTLLKSISIKTEPIKYIYISCTEIRDLINSRNILPVAIDNI